MTPAPLLDSIRKPADIRGLAPAELESLAGQMRQRIFEAVSTNGGHLASNLGVVELTIALHYCYDFGPYPGGPDWLMFDVGHQCYPHKMLTGRAGQFGTLRKRGSIAGFPVPEESPYDLFAVGHAGTAISTAVGMARGSQQQGKNNHVVAVVGDASIVNGLAFEGLNNAGTLKRQMLIILNDNGMSISQPQGAFSEYLERVRVSTTYEEFKRFSEKIVHRLPTTVGHAIEHAWDALCSSVKSAMWAGQMFEAMGIKYMGPIDGHDLPGLINFLAEIKHVDKPVVLHVKTQKGNGYEITKNEPTKFHSPAAFRVEGSPLVQNGCRVEINKGTGKNWTTAFADAAIAVAKRDSRVVTLTAAMPDGTGLSKFEKEIPERFIDTGICESHLVAMAAGMAKTGLRPIAAVYSTFIQRAFDQVWQEVALNKLPVIFALDRAGYVGDDGAVHHGFCDLAFLRPLPGMTLIAPTDEAELNRALRLSLKLDTAVAIRYPRDNVPTCNFEEEVLPELREQASGEWELGKSRMLIRHDGEADATLVVYGALAGSVLTAAELLSADGVKVDVVDARFCKPIDGAMLARVLRPGHPVLTVEDHSLENGFGSAVLEYANSHRLPTDQITRLGMPDRMIVHMTRKEQLTEVGLDPAGIVSSVKQAIERAGERSDVAPMPAERYV
ncbi:1-deoxy-D-xylulose-5-phosphate synthase [Humisphaera borealis]|uniref:1-deoxy-D-xylulose-5-phosphate synthase n=1 Tax=Humisphaera borealis TaxID=2807512 RepID=A0A7M2WWV0_9BACT|nr:1-deoxy-D-xylulose-5-phosphate synthase [Humisphaera borealis]QOV88990.1 1-deoxy-D-xylulose-5-phosphate synthase [Humisphaera borealis]